MSLKMMPIKYRERYGTPNEYVSGGFTPYRRGEDAWIDERIVEIEPGFYCGGPLLEVRIIDKVFSHVRGNHEEVIYSICIWGNHPDHRIEECKKEYIIPDANQLQLMYALASNELRGRYAEGIVTSLFVDLIVLNPISKFRDYLPDVFKFWENLFKDEKGNNREQ